MTGRGFGVLRHPHWQLAIIKSGGLTRHYRKSRDFLHDGFVACKRWFSGVYHESFQRKKMTIIAHNYLGTLLFLVN